MANVDPMCWLSVSNLLPSPNDLDAPSSSSLPSLSSGLPPARATWTCLERGSERNVRGEPPVAIAKNDEPVVETKSFGGRTCQQRVSPFPK